MMIEKRDAEGVNTSAEIVANLPDESPSTTGKKHIVVDGDVLCGDTSVRDNIEKKKYSLEDDSTPLGPYPHRVCLTCGRKYLKEYESNDERFGRVKQLSEGDWIEFETENGEVLTGVVSSSPEPKTLKNRLNVIVSGEPEQRRVYGVESKYRIKQYEGEPPVADPDLGVEDNSVEVSRIEQVDGPKTTPTEKAAGRLAEAQEVIDVPFESVQPIGSELGVFKLKFGDDLSKSEFDQRVGAVDAVFEVTEKNFRDSDKLLSRGNYVFFRVPVED